MRFEFGDHVLDTDRRELTSGSRLIPVSPKVFDLLLYLIENRDRVVSKDDLVEAVWDGRIVSDSTVTSHMNAVRKAVGDTGEERNLIRTLARKGFRFVGEVTARSPSADAVPTDDAPPSTAKPATQPSLADKPSVAVLPFVNMSGDQEQEYFSDGMAEDLITDLSKVSGLLVVARNSSFAFKGKAVDVKDIAGKLGVRHILEGSVRKMGSRLRVNAQLIDVADGGHIWAERYDGNMEEIFEFQDDIREQIVSALRVSLSPSDPLRSERKPAKSARAYDLCLKGRAHYHRFTTEDLFEAIKCFEQAIDEDPNFADAYGNLSRCYFHGWIRVLFGFEDGLDRASELAEKGVALDGTSATALARLGWVQAFQRRFDPAIANLEKALALAPDDADVNSTFAQVLNFWGDPERGRRLQENAFSMEVYPSPSWDWHIGHSHFLLRNYDLAIASLSRNAPRFPTAAAYSYLACAYVELGHLDEARAAMQKQLEATPYVSIAWFDQRVPYRLPDVRDRILDGLRKAGMPEG